jgi:hypothetical protein
MDIQQKAIQKNDTWRIDNLHNYTHHYNIQYNDTQHNYTQHNDIRHNIPKHNSIRHNDTRKKYAKHNNETNLTPAINDNQHSNTFHQLSL